MLENDTARSFAHAHFVRSSEVQRQTAEASLDSIVQAAKLIADCFRNARKLMICGNGGSAADSQHMAAEFLNRLSKEVDRPGLPAIALTTDTSFLTSYANDCGYDGVFERQLRAIGQPEDVLIGISTSGNSRNVIRAVIAAREVRVKTIGLIGEGGEMTDLVDQAVIVPSRDTQHIQETLLTVEHVLCMLVEQSLF